MMKQKLSVFLLLGLGLSAAAVSVCTLLPPSKAEIYAPAAAVSTPPEPELAAWWNEQAAAAEKNGQPEAAAEYKARTAALLSSLQTPPKPAVSAEGVSELPQLMDAALYVRTPRPAPSRPLAKFEPASGVYLGMLGADKRVGYDFAKIEGVYGRKHAMYLAYVGWRKFQTDTSTYFPKSRADRVKALGGALQIGWEPRYGLDDVKDDEYVRTFAREAKASGIPVFLRYASEMNGAWVPWHGEPEKYIEKFRMIHDIMAEEAPNVAMVWSPNFAPADQIDEYYPGDAYVDWVGFSLYSTPLTNGQEDLTPTVIDHFTPLYAKYSHKPIMISEGAVAHTILTSNKAYEAWGEGQLGYMYAYLPRMFPMVKAMTYFSFGRAQAMRSNMEYLYDLGENAFMDAVYKKQIRSELFLNRIEQGASAVSYQYAPVKTPSLPQGKQSVLIYARLKDGVLPFAVALEQGDKRLGISYEMPWEVTVDAAAADQTKPWRIVAYNRQMEPIAAGAYKAAAGLDGTAKKAGF